MVLFIQFPKPQPGLEQEAYCAGAKIGVLAKIESADSVSHLDEILDAVDGAMVARGDLGAELPVEEVMITLLRNSLSLLSELYRLCLSAQDQPIL